MCRSMACRVDTALQILSYLQGKEKKIGAIVDELYLDYVECQKYMRDLVKYGYLNKNGVKYTVSDKVWELLK